MHIDIIQELLIDRTEQMLCSWKRKGQRVTHSKIDMLPVADMLEHIDYEQADEIQVMLDTLSRTMKKSRMYIQDTSLENTLLVTWGKHIVLHSGIEGEVEKERTLNLLSKLWKQITKECTPQECQSYSLQMLIPFMDLGGKDAGDMLIRVWKTLNLYSQTSLIYLLLYTEFRYWFIDGRVHEWIRTNDQTVRYEFEKIRSGEFGWDEQIAWQYWLDWSQYSRPRGDIGMKQFENFSRSADALKKGEKEQMKISVLLCI